MLNIRNFQTLRYSNTSSCLFRVSSNLKNNVSPAYQAEKHYSSQGLSDPDFLHESILPTMHFQRSLPRLKIPKLEKTCARYLESQRVILNDAEFNKTKAIVEKFQAKEGPDLHQALVALDKQNKHTSYISGPWFDMYLESRLPLLLNFNPYICYNSDSRPEYMDQVTRSTNFVVSAMRFMKTLHASKLDPDLYHLNPKKTDNEKFRRRAKWIPGSLAAYYAIMNQAFALDMSQYGNLFKSTRIPCQGRDELVRLDTARHLLVIHNGKFYTFDVLDSQGAIVPPEEIKAHLQYILADSSPRPEFSVSYMTTENRDTWASLRQHLLNGSDRNRETMKLIDGAVFCLCLDDTEPTEAVGLTRSMLYGDGANRWFDKSFQMIVAKNGVTGLNFEHAWGDGVAVLRFMNESYKDTTENAALAPGTKPADVDSVQKVTKLEFDLDPTIKTGITDATEKYNTSTGNLNIGVRQFDKFGKNFIKTKKMSPDAFMQLSFQMGYYRLTGGKVASTYESCSTAAFKHGRTETLRSATMETKKCSEAFQEGSGASVADKKKLLKACSDKHNDLTKNAAMGQGFDRHLFAMKALANKQGQSVALFEDPAYAQLNHIVLSTSTLSSPAVLAGGFAPVVFNGLGVGYGIKDEELGCNITSYPDSPNVNEFLDCVESSWVDMHQVFTLDSD
ncbi:carnitine O-palmitoyltransferase 2, mitochondrial-like [Anneissia japonica]|uniref:carnitine O-palmitoyltransferase 2, mitochondrial-like n=1 Tax=Anneissia japonica TaxID=1529436 RepID=UPI0014259A5B|nr:carnitine O-palmitoyltransferase 2, mitochondrial-like [Anneissia japonica]